MRKGRYMYSIIKQNLLKKHNVHREKITIFVAASGEIGLGVTNLEC